MNKSKIIFVLSVKESIRNKVLTISTYLTENILTNNKGKYNGHNIESADIYNSIFNNIDIEECRNYFRTRSFQINKNSFYFSLNNLLEFIDIYGKQGCVFLEDRDYSLYQIDDVANTETRSKKFFYDFGFVQFKYNINIKSINFTENYVSNVEIIAPETQLIYNYKSNIYLLLFKYGNEFVELFGKKCTFINENRIILKDYEYEINKFNELTLLQFHRVSSNKFRYLGHEQNLEITLLENGIQLLTDNDGIIPQIVLSKKDNDWFDISLNCQIDDEIINLSNNIDLFSKNLKIKGKNLIIPEALIKASDEIKIDSTGYHINKKNFFSLSRLAYLANDNKIKFNPSNVEIKLRNGIKERLYEYQITGVKWLKYLFENNIGGCLADDMGLGKTFQAIAFLEDESIKKTINKVLVISPKSLLINWKNEFIKFESSYKIGIYHGVRRNCDIIKDNDVIISTYSTVKNDISTINNYSFSIVIFDEIQTIKNYESETSKELKKINSNIKIGLSGTPMENNISELWNILDCLNNSMFYDRKYFVDKYQYGNKNELVEVIKPFILRRLKKEVLKQLPPKIEKVVYCNMDAMQNKLYSALTNKIKEEINNMGSFASAVVLKGLMLLRECCCDPRLLNDNINLDKTSESCKIDALNILIDNIVLSGNKVIIFSQFKSMLKIIELVLNRYKDIIYYIDGETSNRQDIVNSFEKNDKGIFLISMKAGGVGLNITTASEVIIYDPWWNPFAEQQAIDRCYRIGQKKCVNVYKLIVSNTIEEKIIELQNDKNQAFDDIINGINSNIDLKKICDLL